MHQSEVNDAWEPEVAMAQPPAADTFAPAADTFAPASDPDDGTARPRVLARMPDLDATEPSVEAEKKSARWDGRMISQRLSIKLLVGGGIALLLAAVAPFVLNGKDNTNRDNGLPDWHQGLPAPDSEEAPAWTPATVQTQPQTPARDGRSRSCDLRRPLPPSGGVDPPQSPTTRGMPNFVPQAEAYTNRPMTIEQRAGYPTDHPREYQPRSRPPVEPGVARLEGVIRKPSVRTTHDRARSSIR
jgi:hypothetical protein